MRVLTVAMLSPRVAGKVQGEPLDEAPGGRRREQRIADTDRVREDRLPCREALASGFRLAAVPA